jgi:hypothetical protein
MFDLRAQFKITSPLPKKQKKNVNQQKKLPLLLIFMSNYFKGQETSKKQSPKNPNKNGRQFS